MNAKLIALTGPAYSGKTTIAKVFEARGFVRVRFADTLKRMLREFGLTEAQVDGAEKEIPCDALDGHTPRWAMKTLGTQWGREQISVDIWVLAAMRTVDQLLAGQRDVVIDDCRFSNEAKAVLARGGFVVSLVREGSGIGTDHASERGIPRELVDTFVYNNQAPIATADAVIRRLEEVAKCRTH